MNCRRFMGLTELGSMSIFFPVYICCPEVTNVGKRLCKTREVSSVRFWLAVFLGIFFCAGGAVGAVFAFLCSSQSTQEIERYLVEYLAVTKLETLNHNGFLLAWGYILACFAVFLLGRLSFGVIGIPIVFAYRGFLGAFACCCFVRVFGSAGIVLAAVLFLLPAILWFPAFSLLGIQGMRRSRTSDTSVALDGWIEIALTVALLFLCGIAEYALIPRLLKSLSWIIL